MLQTQVNYWDLLENMRSHRMNERIQWAQTQENQRHNLASESLNAESIAESVRHNVQSEAQGWRTISLNERQLQEAKRHNVRSEKIQNRQVTEAKRHNKAVESESIRHNKAGEAISSEANRIGYYNAVTGRMNAETARQNITLGYSELSEAVRSHKAQESNTQFSNTTQRVTAYESQRHNKATEGIQQQSANTGSYSAATNRMEYEWARSKFMDYDYPLTKTRSGFMNFESVASGFQNITSGIRNIAGAVDAYLPD